MELRDQYWLFWLGESTNNRERGFYSKTKIKNMQRETYVNKSMPAVEVKMDIEESYDLVVVYTPNDNTIKKEKRTTNRTR